MRLLRWNQTESESTERRRNIKFKGGERTARGGLETLHVRINWNKILSWSKLLGLDIEIVKRLQDNISETPIVNKFKFQNRRANRNMVRHSQEKSLQNLFTTLGWKSWSKPRMVILEILKIKQIIIPSSDGSISIWFLHFSFYHTITTTASKMPNLKQENEKFTTQFTISRLVHCQQLRRSSHNRINCNQKIH